jgi:hemerythrin-like domain-containing protein
MASLSLEGLTMDPIETLSNEHGLIRQYLDNLALATTHLEEGRRPSRAFFEKGIDFARTFADRFHHFKEEHVLFVRLAQRKRGEIDAQVEALRQQHERGRELMSAVAAALDGYEANDEGRTAELVENLAAYVALLRHHIHLEDHVFYPMACKTLSADEISELEAEFARQRDKDGAGTFERSHKTVVDMGSIITHLH